MRLWSVTVFFISSCKASSKFAAPSSSSANCFNSSATAVLSTTFVQETDEEEPSIRNSNLLPVNAKGEVLLRSVVSLGNLGSVCTPILRISFSLPPYGSSFSIAFKTSVSSVPRNIETTAGGASLAPSLWSFPAEATDTLSISWYSSTALITAQRKVKNCAFSYGVSPGFKRFTPVSVVSDQLLCLPLPFTPAKGFSCSRHTIWCFLATFCIISIVSWL